MAFLVCLLLLIMAAFDRKEANVKKLKEANAIQDRTEAAISRIQRQTAEVEELGAQTLDELRRQGQQMVWFFEQLPIPSHQKSSDLILFFSYHRTKSTQNLSLWEPN